MVEPSRAENKTRSHAPHRSPEVIRKLILEKLRDGDMNKNSLSIATHTDWPKVVQQLKQLIAANCVTEVKADHVKKGASFFKITPDGLETLQKLDDLSKNPTLKLFLPSHPKRWEN